MKKSEDMLKVSVIIPIYNIQSYVAECVESILVQSWHNIEIILVDDGSTDDSPQICDDIKDEDARVVVVHKANGGLSDARNAGIKIATGDYIMFLDGDDFWDDSYVLERLVSRISETKADVLNFSYKKFYEDTGKKVPYFECVPEMPKNLIKKEEQLNYLTKNNLYIASACNKMIRRTLFDSELMFVPGIYSEDIEWCARLLGKAKSMDFICENFYCYRQRTNSITHTITQKKCEDLCNNIMGCVEYAADIQEPIKTYLYRYAAYQFGTFFIVQAQADKQPLQCIYELKKYKWLLDYHGSNRKLRILYLSCKVVGYVRICKLIRLLYRK